MRKSCVRDVSEVSQDDSFELRVGIWRLISEENQISHKILSRKAEPQHSTVADIQRTRTVEVSSKLKIATAN